MNKSLVTQDKMAAFREFLAVGEKAGSTVEKYLRDVSAFAAWNGSQALSREAVLEYKTRLQESGYKPGSVNSMIVSLNRFFDFLGRPELKLRTLKLQRPIYCPEEKELSRSEFERLVLTARRRGKARLEMLLQTLVATGIRVSELPFITVEAAKAGKATVSLKGKIRPVIIVDRLRRLLLAYAKGQGISSGPIFVTRSGRPMDRTHVWREMKGLCQAADVDPRKVFPHNLRHLFARIFYQAKKDIVKLADVLGHANVETTRLYVISTGAEHRRYLESLRLLV